MFCNKIWTTNREVDTCQQFYFVFSWLFFCKLPAISCSFLRSTVGKSRRKAWPNNVTRKSSTRSKKRQNGLRFDFSHASILSLPETRFSLPCFSFPKARGLRKHTEPHGSLPNGWWSERGYRSIVFHWFPLAQISWSSAPSPLPTGSRPPADFYLGFGKTSRQLGGWAADSGECESKWFPPTSPSPSPSDPPYKGDQHWVKGEMDNV